MQIHIITGFFGSGKTTFINKYIPLLRGKTAFIQNEFGEVEFEKPGSEGDTPIEELNAGCICCSLAMDFRKGIREIADKYQPAHLLIEPTGMSKLSDVVKACKIARERDYVDLLVTKQIVLVEASDYEDCMEDFGEFYRDQIVNAGAVFLTHVTELEKSQIERLVSKIKEVNPTAVICTQDFRKISGKELLHYLDESPDLEGEGERLKREENRESEGRGKKHIKYR